MSTWLQTGPSGLNGRQRTSWRATVRTVVADLDSYFPDDQAAYLSDAGGDPAFSLWLRLADEQLDRLAERQAGRPVFPWRETYEAGWSPRRAACTAWSGLGSRSDILATLGITLPTAGREGVVL